MAGTIDHTDGHEVVGTVVTSQGKFVMVVLQLRDVMHILSDKTLSEQEQSMYMVAASIGVPGKEFMEWQVPDALKIVNLYNEATKKL